MKLPYDFRSWLWTVNGAPLSGFAEGDDCVTCERSGDSFSISVGADGRMTVIRSADRSGKITFKFAANSESNTYLGVLMDLEEAGPAQFVPIRFGAQDQALQDVCTGAVGVLVRPSTMVRGAGKPGDQEWSIYTERLDIKYGGASIFDL